MRNPPDARTSNLQMILFAALLVAPIQTSEEAYRDLQARLSRYATVRIQVVPISGNAWDHDWECGYVRPNKGYVSGTGRYFRSNGRVTWSAEFCFVDVTHGRVLRARPGDVAKGIGLTGFESFFACGSKVEGSSPVRMVAQPQFWAPALALDLKIDGKPRVVYLDPRTRLPLGSESVGYGIELGARFAPGTFDPPKDPKNGPLDVPPLPKTGG